MSSPLETSYQRLKKASHTLAVSAAVTATDEITAKPQLTVEDFITLAILCRDLPYTDYDRKYNMPYSRITYWRKDGHSGELHWLIVSEFNKSLKNPQHQSVVNSLAERANFLRLYNTYRVLAIEVLKSPHFIQVFFNGILSFDDFRSLIEESPALADDLAEYQRDYVNIAVCSTAKLDDWLWLATKIAKYSSESDWVTMTKVGEVLFDKLTHRRVDQPEIALQKSLQAVFSNAENLTQLASVSPGICAKVIEVLQLATYTETKRKKNRTYTWENARHTQALFTDSEKFWQFLQASGKSSKLREFNIRVLEKFPRHLQFIFDRSNNFISLDSEFLYKLLDEYATRDKTTALIESSAQRTQILSKVPSLLNYYMIRDNPKRLVGFAVDFAGLLMVVKSEGFRVAGSKEYNSGDFVYEATKTYIASSECAIPGLLYAFAPPGDSQLLKLEEAHPLLFNMLIRYHGEKMAALLDMKIFMQLDRIHRREFVSSATRAIADLFAKEDISLKSFKSMVEIFCVWDKDIDPQTPFYLILKPNAEKFAKMFIYGEKADQKLMLKDHPGFTNFLFEHAPEIMAQRYHDSRFAKLLRSFPSTGILFFNKCKSNVARLITTEYDLSVVKSANPQLMEQFEKDDPSQFAKIGKR